MITQMGRCISLGIAVASLAHSSPAGAQDPVGCDATFATVRAVLISQLQGSDRDRKRAQELLAQVAKNIAQAAKTRLSSVSPANLDRFRQADTDERNSLNHAIIKKSALKDPSPMKISYRVGGGSEGDEKEVSEGYTVLRLAVENPNGATALKVCANVTAWNSFFKPEYNAGARVRPDLQRPEGGPICEYLPLKVSAGKVVLDANSERTLVASWMKKHFPVQPIQAFTTCEAERQFLAKKVKGTACEKELPSCTGKQNGTNESATSALGESRKAGAPEDSGPTGEGGARGAGKASE
jgi:hypothetical protein